MKQIYCISPKIVPELRREIKEKLEAEGATVICSPYTPEPILSGVLAVLDKFLGRYRELTEAERAEILETLRVMRKPIITIPTNES